MSSELRCHGYSCEDEGNYPSSSLKKCSGCQKAWYCSKECQVSHWKHHIFDCKPAQVKTAHHLMRAVHRDIIPAHEQTRDDYGFNRAVTVDNEKMLFGLYVGLIIYLDVEPITLHRWRLQGGASFVREIKRAFERLPAGSRGGYYAWFLEHEYILDGSLPQPEDSKPKSVAIQLQRRAWTFIGGSPSASDDEIVAEVRRMSEERWECFFFYTLALGNGYPGPQQDMWVKLGFCGCSHEVSEMELSGYYQRLIRSCTFDEFCDAYSNSRLVALFGEKGIGLDNGTYASDIRFIADILADSPRGHKSVWSLKTSLLRLEAQGNDELGLCPPILVDYGFFNCKNAEEKLVLTQAYKKYFARPSDVDPLALHQAAIEGKLFEHVGQFVKLEPQRLYKRLLKNLCPLPPPPE